MSYKLPQFSEVTFAVTCEPCDIPVRGNAMASGDDALDREHENAVFAELESGNDWAWCDVTVRATYNGFSGTNHLGACSYDSEENFREPGGYFDDMCREAFDALIDTMKDAAERLGCDADKPITTLDLIEDQHRIAQELGESDDDEQCDQWGRPV